MAPERRPGKFGFDKLVALAREAALKHGGHIPILIIEGSLVHGVMQLEHLPDTHEERVRQMFNVGASVAHGGQVGNLERITFISEGWMSIVSEDGTIEVPPSQDPDRIEILSIMRIELSGEIKNIGAIYEMIRDPGGLLLDLKKIERFGEDERETFRSPLLEAFVQGYAAGIGGIRH